MKYQNKLGSSFFVFITRDFQMGSEGGVGVLSQELSKFHKYVL